jgi:hypothetical protein
MHSMSFPSRLPPALLPVLVIALGGGFHFLHRAQQRAADLRIRKATEEAALSVAAAQAQVEALSARVRALEAENAHWVAAAARVAKPEADASAPQRAHSAPPARPAETPTIPAAAGPELLGGLAEILAGALTNGTAGATMVTGRPSQAMAQFIRTSLDLSARQEAQSRATELASRLGLDDDQRARIAERLAERHAAANRSIDRLLAGEAPGLEEAQALEDSSQESSAWFADLLTPEQRQEYDAWQHAEERSAREATALRRLADLQSALPDLSQDQKDRLYAHYASPAGEGANPALAGLPAELALLDPRAREAENAALAEILTPAQAEAWKARQESGAGAVIPLGPHGSGQAVIRTIQFAPPAGP